MAEVGAIGSNNGRAWKARGWVGGGTSGSARDTDEIIAQQGPLYYARPGRGIRTRRPSGMRRR